MEIVVNNKHQVAHRTIEIEFSLDIRLQGDKVLFNIFTHFWDLGLDMTSYVCLILIGQHL